MLTIKRENGNEVCVDTLFFDGKVILLLFVKALYSACTSFACIITLSTNN